MIFFKSRIITDLHVQPLIRSFQLRICKPRISKCETIKLFLCQPILHGFKQEIGMASSKKLCCRRALTLLIHCRERKPPLLSPNSLLGQCESIYLLISVAPCSKQFSMLKEEFMFKFKKKSHLKTKKSRAQK